MAAGLGFKTFTTGEVLTSADTNGYLMQGVLVFASSAARAAAITSPQEGQYSYLKDTNSTEYYDGAAWIAAPIGDITGVTAGTGISGGGTSGTVTITNSMATAIDAKGDLIGGTGADAFDRLAVGADGTQLVADSAEATGLKWATPAAGGKVLQVVYADVTTAVYNSTSTYADTGLTATITPTLITSKVLVLTSHQGVIKSSASNLSRVQIRLVRGATNILTICTNTLYTATALGQTQSISSSYLDSPATTSATTYKTQFNNQANAALVGINDGSPTDTSTIILMEIGA
jgi:trimeric autotransporter adhesin